MSLIDKIDNSERLDKITEAIVNWLLKIHMPKISIPYRRKHINLFVRGKDTANYKPKHIERDN